MVKYFFSQVTQCTWFCYRVEQIVLNIILQKMALRPSHKTALIDTMFYYNNELCLFKCNPHLGTAEHKPGATTMPKLQSVCSNTVIQIHNKHTWIIESWQFSEECLQ